MLKLLEAKGMTLNQLKKENRIGIIIYDKSCIKDDTALFMRVIGAIKTVETKTIETSIIYLCYHETFTPIVDEILIYGVHLKDAGFYFQANDDDWLESILDTAQEFYKNYTLKKKVNKL